MPCTAKGVIRVSVENPSRQEIVKGSIDETQSINGRKLTTSHQTPNLFNTTAVQIQSDPLASLDMYHHCRYQILNSHYQQRPLMPSGA